MSNPFGQPYSVNINGNNLNVVTIIPHDVSLLLGQIYKELQLLLLLGTPNDTFQSFLTPPGATECSFAWDNNPLAH